MRGRKRTMKRMHDIHRFAWIAQAAVEGKLDIGWGVRPSQHALEWMETNPWSPKLTRLFRNYLRSKSKRPREHCFERPRNIRRTCVECRHRVKRRMLRPGEKCFKCRSIVRADGYPEIAPFIRASGDCICERCGLPYRKHPHEHAYLTTISGDPRPWLRRLCNRTLVKL